MHTTGDRWRGGLWGLLVIVLGLGVGCATSRSPWEARDLNPVQFNPAPNHPPVVLVQEGRPLGRIVVVGKAPPERVAAARQLQQFIKQATGAELPLVQDEVKGPAIVIGDGPAAVAQGLVGSQLPKEGFAIKTTADQVLIVGNPTPVDGTVWGITEFLERYVGVRWYLPEADLGLSIPAAPTLVVPPVDLRDAPVFPMRVIWPDCQITWNGSGTQLGPLHHFLRKGNSWSHQLVVHNPNWAGVQEYREKCPEVFQLKSDGTRDFEMLCYGNPQTLTRYLENIDRHYRQQPPFNIGIVGDTITVSPNDADVVCHCPDCQRLWDPNGGTYGSASQILGTFVAKLGTAVKQRWPGKTVLFLAYLNYTRAPKGIVFPDNVEVQICGMPGMAMYAQPAVRQEEQANLEAWAKLTGGRVQNWHYSCWPENRTQVPFQYPHVVKQYYQENRGKIVGSFINGETDHWPRQNLTLYCWMKALWNPEYDVDAAADTFCQRMFGPAAGPIRQVLRIQTERWENVVWPGGLLSRKTAFDLSYPPSIAARIQVLIQRAKAKAAGDALATRRLAYYCASLEGYVKKSKEFAEGRSLNPLEIMKVGEDPVLDGRLDDAVWVKAKPNSFVRATDREHSDPQYPTTVQAVWTPRGVTFGVRMVEPAPTALVIKNTGDDNPALWWDDNIEIFVDVTGKGMGEFYQFIFNSKCSVFDSRQKDLAWKGQGVKCATFVGKDFWSIEVFMPYRTFPDALVPGTNTRTRWLGNLTRHRLGDYAQEPASARTPNSRREYQRMNTTFSPVSANLEDFSEFQFLE